MARVVEGAFRRIGRSKPAGWLRRLFSVEPNLPKLAGDALGVGGLICILLALKEPWFGVPGELVELPGGGFEATLSRSPWEGRIKVALLVAFALAVAFFVVFRKERFRRTKVVGNFASLALLGAFAFCHLTMVDEGELSHTAALHVAHHDNLVWYGGEITTSRGQEPYGNAADFISKDLPLLVSAVPLPYRAQDLASFQDYLSWTGLGPAFWHFFNRGWAFLLFGGVLLMTSALCVRLGDEKRGFGSEVVGWVVKRTGAILFLWFALIFGRSQLAAHHLESARRHFEDGRWELSLDSLGRAKTVMPCLAWDGSVIFQEADLEARLGKPTPGSDLNRAFAYEMSGRHQAATRAYQSVLEDWERADPPVRAQAVRGLMRQAVDDFNAGRNFACREKLAAVRSEYPCLLKPIFLRFMIAVRNGELETAKSFQGRLYAVGDTLQMPNRRAYLASSHQYVSQLAFDRGDTAGAWQNYIYRIELDGQKGRGEKTGEKEGAL